MKRLLLAGLLALPLALSRTGARADQDDAYGSLVGMAGSAASDRGPEAGDIPPDNPSIETRSSSPAASAAPAAAYAPARAEKPAKPVPAPAAKREAAKDDDAPSVAVPAASAPRVWTKVFSTLLPPAARAAGFEVAASTASRGARPSTPASAAGSAQGLLELVAAATAPSLEP